MERSSAAITARLPVPFLLPPKPAYISRTLTIPRDWPTISLLLWRISGSSRAQPTGQFMAWFRLMVRPKKIGAMLPIGPKRSVISRVVKESPEGLARNGGDCSFEFRNPVAGEGSLLCTAQRCLCTQTEGKNEKQQPGDTQS